MAHPTQAPGRSTAKHEAALHSVRLGCLVGLGSEVGGSRSTLREEAGEDWLNQ